MAVIERSSLIKNIAKLEGNVFSEILKHPDGAIDVLYSCLNGPKILLPEKSPDRDFWDYYRSIMTNIKDVHENYKGYKMWQYFEAKFHQPRNMDWKLSFFKENHSSQLGLCYDSDHGIISPKGMSVVRASDLDYRLLDCFNELPGDVKRCISKFVQGF